MSDYVSIRTAIASKLATVTEFYDVIDFHTMNFNGYPAATFEPAGNEDLFATTKDNLRNYDYRVVLHQEMEHGGRDNAINILCPLADAVITAFDTDPTLGGVVKYCLPVRTFWSEYTGGDGAIKAVEITLRCFDLAQVATPV